MDHCPGYGSTARYLAIAAREAGLDTSAMRRTDPIKVIEVAGRNAGWLAAAAALGRKRPEDAPQVIFFPERRRPVRQMLEEIRAAHDSCGWAVIIICENQRTEQGQPLAGGAAVYVDPYGHPYHESAGAFLARAVQSGLGLRARYERPGSLQRTSALAISDVDLAEARGAGAEAVRLALEGQTDVMVTLQRLGPPYAVAYGAVALEMVAQHERQLPDEFIAPSGTDVTDAFLDYARPLIGGPLPVIVTL
jgi:6-phosphofructokinase 1